MKRRLPGKIPPIALKDVLNFYQQSRSDLKHKGKSVSVQVQTAHFGIGANVKQAGMYFWKKTAQKLDCIKNSPLSIIIAVLKIYWEVIPLMINVGPITTWELFKMLCTGTAVAEFNEILLKVSADFFEFIQVDFKKKICLTY